MECSVWCVATTDFTMKDGQHRFLSLLGQLPARLTAEQCAKPSGKSRPNEAEGWAIVRLGFHHGN